MKKIFSYLFIAFIFLFVFSYTNVLAKDLVFYGEGENCFIFDIDTNGFPSSVTVDGYNWDTLNDYRYKSNNNNHTIIILAGKKGNEFPTLSTPGGFRNQEGVTIDERPNPNDDPNVVGDEYKFTITLTNYDNSVSGGCTNVGGLTLQAGDEVENPYRDVEGNITISISGEELEYHYVADKPDEADVTYFKFAINSQISEDLVPFTFGNANYTYIDGKEPPKNVSKVETKQPIRYRYRYNDTGTVEFCVNGGGTDEYTKIEINNHDYSDQAPHTQKDYFKNYGGGGSLQFCIKGVPYDPDGYSVVVEGREVSDDKKVSGFDWSYLSHDRSEDVPVENEGDFAHGKVEFVHAKFVDDENRVYEFNSASEYNAGRYEETGEIFQWANGNKKYPEEDRRLAGGNVIAPYGTELTIRIVPDEGYQLTSMTTSEHGFQATDEVGVYKISLTRENLKFQDNGFRLEPVFTKIGSEVQATSNNVKGGTIETNEKVQNGSIKLSVTDANVSNDSQTAFENKASEQGYTVSNIVDISLYNSVYKGGKKDDNGNYLSWDTELNNLSNKASIALELGDNVSGKEVALVHELHDENGPTGYEFVNANYNSGTNTIEFEEDNFSNFAIVVRNSENNEENHGDKEMVRVDFDTRAEKGIDPVEIEKGSKVSKPKDPTQDDLLFVGWYTDENCEHEYDFNTPVNDNLILFAKWTDKVQTYTVKDGNGNSLTFNEIKNRRYKLTLIDITKLNDKELEAIGATREQYNQVKDILTSATEQHGDLIAFYQIEINDKDDGASITEGPFKIKIKITDEMRKYNVFKLIYVNDSFEPEQVIELKVENGYLVGELPHLSGYTLNATYDSNLPDIPKTFDGINTWFIILTLSIISIGLTTVIYKKKFN